MLSCSGWNRSISRACTRGGEEPDEFVVDHGAELLQGTVLDLGSGDGRIALFLARRGFRVVAVDVVDAVGPIGVLAGFLGPLGQAVWKLARST